MTIGDYQELHALPDGALVRDGDGGVWCVQHYPEFDDETWCVPFSDEYAFMIEKGGKTSPLGDTPTLPLTDLGIVNTRRG